MTKSPAGKKPNKQKVVSGSVKKKRQPPVDAHATLLSLWGSWIFLGISAFIFLYARLKLLAIPMERDEAGFAYIGHWLFRDKSLYVDMVDNKLPGLYFLYGLFTNVFGYTATGVHVGLFVTNIATGVL